jgi:hypothetical protein
MENNKTIEITICGGGNGSHASAAVIGSNKEFKVNILTRKPQDWGKVIVGDPKGIQSKLKFQGRFGKIEDYTKDK